MKFRLWLGIALSVAAACTTSRVLNPNTDPEPPTLDGDVPDGDPSLCNLPKYQDIQISGQDATLRMGWGGIGSAIRLNDGFSFSVELKNCDKDCSRCDFDGPVTIPRAKIKNTRCVGNTAISCEKDANCAVVKCDPGEDADSCALKQSCRYFFGPNLNVGLGILDVCATVLFEPVVTLDKAKNQVIEPAVQGNVNFLTGDSTVNVLNLKLTTFLACGECLGESAEQRFDGVRSGGCKLPNGTKGPVKCDVVALGPKSGDPSDYSFQGSYDCRPTAQLTDGAQVNFAPIKTNSLFWKLDGNSQTCSLADGKKCWCGSCTLKEGTGDPPACHVNSDCNPVTTTGKCEEAPFTKPDACYSGTEAQCKAGEDHFTSCTLSSDPELAKRGLGTCNVCIGPDRDPRPSPDGTLPNSIDGWTWGGGTPEAPQPKVCIAGGGVIWDEELETGSKVTVKGRLSKPDADGIAHPTFAGLTCNPPSSKALAVAEMMGLPGPTVFEVPSVVRSYDADGKRMTTFGK